MKAWFPPGGVGYDINCGVRLLRTGLSRVEISNKLESVVNTLFTNIPSGVGSHRKDLKLSQHEVKNVLKNGARWAISHGYGTKEDLEHIEEKGCIPGADPELVSNRAIERGLAQLGTPRFRKPLCRGWLCIQRFTMRKLPVLGLEKDGVTIVVHTGSRGLGYQVCDDFIRVMIDASRKYNIELPDRQLCCALLIHRRGKNILLRWPVLPIMPLPTDR